MAIDLNTGKSVNRRAIAIQLVLVTAIAVLWNTPLVYPLKILVVFFHELSHGMAAVLTGGEIVEIQVVAGQGGHCVTRGGSRFLTLSAGYLGSSIWGGTILVMAARTRWDRAIAVVLGTMLAALSVMYLRPFLSFGFGFGLVAGLTLVAFGRWGTERLNDLTLRTIGLTSCIYALLDIKSDVLDRPHLRSDAVMLGELTHISSTIWGIVWVVIALMFAVFFVVIASRNNPD